MSPEKKPRQPRKPFQSAGKREKKPVRQAGQDRPPRRASEGKPFEKSAPAGRRKKPVLKKARPDDSRYDNDRNVRRGAGREKQYTSEHESDRPVKRVVRKEKPYTSEQKSERPVKRTVRKAKSHTSEHGSERPVKRVFSKTRSESGPKKYPLRRGIRVKPGSSDDSIRLNKYIANAGICSRREADQLIQAGVIKVNGVVVSELGTKVKPGDKVQYGDQTLSNERKRYLLLNKQKGYVTTTKDPHAKNTVMELIAGACKERIYPVGRLDRNTTGLLFFTNDGELAKKLMHPSSRVKKMYHVVLDQPLKKNDLLKIADGVELEDGKVFIDSIAYVEDAADRREVGMEIHSGQNRVVRRIFESLGYKVTKLDRVMFAGLTKKNLPRGKWRFLSEREVIDLIRIR